MQTGSATPPTSTVRFAVSPAPAASTAVCTARAISTPSPAPPAVPPGSTTTPRSCAATGAIPDLHRDRLAWRALRNLHSLLPGGLSMAPDTSMPLGQCQPGMGRHVSLPLAGMFRVYSNCLCVSVPCNMPFCVCFWCGICHCIAGTHRCFFAYDPSQCTQYLALAAEHGSAPGFTEDLQFCYCLQLVLLCR